MCPSFADRLACTASAGGRRWLRRGPSRRPWTRRRRSRPGNRPYGVWFGRLRPPLVDCPALAGGDDVGFRVGDVLGKEPVLLSSTALGPGGLLARGERSRTAEERHRPVVAGDSGKTDVDEGLPRVGVKGNVPELARPAHVGDVPVAAVVLSGPAGVGGQRVRGIDSQRFSRYRVFLVNRIRLPKRPAAVRRQPIWHVWTIIKMRQQLVGTQAITWHDHCNSADWLHSMTIQGKA